eukprot:CAMPEP_0183401482 /NCGR_PEP_ID=MMETSP0370-20130417/13285_1 /TAXON_ID=268820 /ORGANISM="Peridinium aciculiferum, Strain PAER-2" /LENGTH=45 /DNA_ID= /DNA_START= /DNA_END= /DNA_ORIENTATION=
MPSSLSMAVGSAFVLPAAAFVAPAAPLSSPSPALRASGAAAADFE